MANERDLDRQHPDYRRMLTRWILEQDYYRGGYHVLKPGQHKSDVWWLDQRDRPTGEDGTSPRPDRAASIYEWRTGSESSYLHKHPRERRQSWDSRQARAWHLPLFRPTVNIFASAVLKTGPRRDAPDWWLGFLGDVDCNGTAIDAFVREALTSALVFGRYHSVVDMTTPEMEVRTLRQQDAAGVRPYAYHVSPMDIVNWSLDENGRFRWVQIREDMPDTRSPGDDWPRDNNQYRIWTPTDWYLYRKSVNPRLEWAQVASGAHPVGRVPLPSVYAHRGSRTILGCESPFCDVADTDRSVFNKLSLLDELLYKQTFSILAVARREGSPMADATIAPDMAFVYDAEAGPPSYIAPDASQVLALWRVISDTVGLIRTQSEAGRGAAAEQSAEARSAAAIGAEQGDRNNVMSSLAESMEAYELDLYDCAARWAGKSDKPVATYPRKFDLRTVNQAIADLVQVKQLQVGQRVLSVLTAPILQQMLRETGASQDEIDSMIGDLEADMEDAEESAKLPVPLPPTKPSADEQALRRAAGQPMKPGAA